jgi:hypothetical protein
LEDSLLGKKTFRHKKTGKEESTSLVSDQDTKTQETEEERICAKMLSENWSPQKRQKLGDEPVNIS